MIGPLVTKLAIGWTLAGLYAIAWLRTTEMTFEARGRYQAVAAALLITGLIIAIFTVLPGVNLPHILQPPQVLP